MPRLALCCPTERFFNDFGTGAVPLFGAENTLMYDVFGTLRAQIQQVIAPVNGFDVILIAGHGQMTEDRYNDPLANNRQVLQQAQIAQAAVADPATRWSATLFMPTVVCECTTGNVSRIRMCGPFASYPEDLKAAYEHWQRYGPGGVAALVFRDEVWHMMERLDAANMETFDGTATLNSSINALTERFTPPNAFVCRAARAVRPGVHCQPGTESAERYLNPS